MSEAERRGRRRRAARDVVRAEHGIARAFLLAGALTFAIALLLSYLAGARVSAPLRRMATVAARVDAGDLAAADGHLRRPQRRGARPRRRVQQHARSARRRVRRAARVRRRRVARAPHAADRDPRPARGARGATGALGRGGAPRRAPGAGRDRSDQPPGRRPAAARPVRADRLPAHRADRSAHLRGGAVGRRQPYGREAFRARTGSPRAC